MKPTKILPCFFKDNIISLTSVNDNSIIFEVTFRSIYQGFWYLLYTCTVGAHNWPIIIPQEISLMNNKKIA